MRNIGDYGPLKWFLARLDTFERLTIVLLLSALVVVVFTQVFTRFVLKIPAEWSDEAARFIFIVFCWVGCSYAVRDYLHIRVTAHFRLMSPGAARWTIIAGDVVWIAFNCFAIYGGIEYLRSILEYPYIAIITRVSFFWIFLPIPIMLAFCSLRLVVNFFDPEYINRTMVGEEEKAAKTAETEPNGSKPNGSAAP